MIRWTKIQAVAVTLAVGLGAALVVAAATTGTNADPGTNGAVIAAPSVPLTGATNLDAKIISSPKVIGGGARTGENLTLDLGGEPALSGVEGVKLELAWIPPGEFMMGSPASEAQRDAGETQHQVTLTKGFWMGKYEVTQRQYRQIMEENPSNFQGDDLPVESVDWKKAREFCQKAGRKAGVEMRLPTEAEWEYACRAGTRTVFHYGDSLDASLANFNGKYPYGDGKKGENRQKTTPVGSFKPNAWGLFDMHGNVWEWCKDWYGSYASGPETDPSGPAAGSGRVLRGGSWINFANNCRSARREEGEPCARGGVEGFRVVVLPR
jgi:formylglycine-generating enzyme required for sulfatase activity